MQHPTSSRESFATHHHHSAMQHPIYFRESRSAHRHSAMQHPASSRESLTAHLHLAMQHAIDFRESLTAHRHSAMQHPIALRESLTANDRWSVYLAVKSNYSASSGGGSSSSRRLVRNTKRLFKRARDIASARVNARIRIRQSPEKGDRALPIFLRKRTSIISLREISLFGHGTEEMREFW
jgi:hypothetical protein